MKQIKKIIKPLIVVIFASSLVLAFAINTNNEAAVNNRVQAASFVIPKKLRGTWKSKPTYAGDAKHIKKNIAIPAMKIKVTTKKAKWHYYGYVPSNCYPKKGTIRLISLKYNLTTLKGHGPYRDLNYLRRVGKYLILDYHGGSIAFTRAK